MRYAILDSQKKVVDVRSERPKLRDYIEVDDDQVKYIIDCFNKDCFVYSTEDGLKRKTNVFKLKDKKRKVRDKDLRETDIYMRPDFWNSFSDEEKQKVEDYSQDLRDYINKITTEEDYYAVEYPKKPEFLNKYNIKQR